MLVWVAKSGGWRDDFIAGGWVCGGAMEGNSVVTPFGLTPAFGRLEPNHRKCAMNGAPGTRLW
jgi:hypothetical protein